MTIGEKIKHLRKKQDITQEKLADYLNITYQSVSKWENNTAMPDISMIVPLANFFGVTTDELFDLDRSKKEAVLREYDEKSTLLKNQGKVRENHELWREAVNIYPNDYDCLQKLAYSLCDVSMSNGFSDEEQSAATKEGIAICHRILDDCTDDEIRSGTIQVLTYLYSSSGNQEMAVKTAEKAPSMYCSREILLIGAYEHSDPRFISVRAENDMGFLDLLHQDILLADRKNNAETIQACNALLTIWNTLFYDGNFLFYHCRIQNIYTKLAAIYAEEGNRDHTLASLQMAKYHARMTDDLPDGDIPYSGIFFDGATFNRKDTSKNYTETHTETVRRFTEQIR